jgi:hypothetical protein
MFIIIYLFLFFKKLIFKFYICSIKMPLTSTEYSRRRREKIKQENPEKYKQLRHEENQKYYKKN